MPLPRHVRTFTYDNLGRPASQNEEIDRGNYSIRNDYDALSRVSKVTYPSGLVVQNRYDANGYLQQIERSGGPATVYWKATGYDADGHITQQQQGNGVVTDRLYVPETGMLKEIRSGRNGAATVQNLSCHFDVIGNLRSRADNLQTINGNLLTETFGYAELNRLTSAAVQGQQAKNFEYDLLGNITFKQGTAPTAIRRRLARRRPRLAKRCTGTRCGASMAGRMRSINGTSR